MFSVAAAGAPAKGATRGLIGWGADSWRADGS